MNEFKVKSTLYYLLILISLATFGCTIVIEENPNQIIENEQITEYSTDPLIYFCPEDNCTEVFLNIFELTEESLYCALYNLKKEELLTNLEDRIRFENIDVGIVVEEKNYKDYVYNMYPNLNKVISTDKNSALMHNKFCIIDNKILLVGSANPSNDLEEDYNNILIFDSPSLSKVYTDEYIEIMNGVTGIKAPKQDTNVELKTNTNETYNINPSFCPEECGDDMENRIIDFINSANKSITVAAYSFTKSEIANALIEAKNKGLKITVLMENSQINVMGSVYDLLVENGINVTVESTSDLMHHKVFVIDGKIIITGSMNFSNNGMKRNDENALIIINTNLADKYENEIYRIINSLE